MMGIIMHTISLFRSAAAVVVIAAATSFAATASASPFLPFGQPSQPAPMVQAPADEGIDESAELPARFKRQVVDYRTNELPGTIVIDTPNTYLYLVLGNGRPMRYGIGVGRAGFTWSGPQNLPKNAHGP